MRRAPRGANGAPQVTASAQRQMTRRAGASRPSISSPERTRDDPAHRRAGAPCRLLAPRGRRVVPLPALLDRRHRLHRLAFPPRPLARPPWSLPPPADRRRGAGAPLRPRRDRRRGVPPPPHDPRWGGRQMSALTRFVLAHRRPVVAFWLVLTIVGIA